MNSTTRPMMRLLIYPKVFRHLGYCASIALGIPAELEHSEDLVTREPSLSKNARVDDLLLWTPMTTSNGILAFITHYP